MRAVTDLPWGSLRTALATSIRVHTPGDSGECSEQACEGALQTAEQLLRIGPVERDRTAEVGHSTG